MKLSKHRKAAFIIAGIILLGGALLLAFPSSGPAHAAAHQPQISADYGTMLIKMIVSVALVCLLAYAILRWGLGRLAGNVQGGEQMEVLSRLAVGPDRTIMVVRVGPRFLVVGNTETGISLLTELSDDEAYDFVAAEVSEK